MSNSGIKNVGSMSELYSGLEDRVPTLEAQFIKQFGRQCEFVVRSPGRVNLIGKIAKI
jgi:galactokinase